MSAPGTPGPWCVSVDDYGDVVVDPVGSEDRVCTVGKTGFGKAAVASFGHFDTPDVRADAALIAAAPELYEGAEFLCARLRDLEGFDGDELLRQLMGHVMPALSRLESRLAKARGETL